MTVYACSALRKRLGRRTLAGSQHDFDFQFLGLIGLADPVRPSVPAAVEECRKRVSES